MPALPRKPYGKRIGGASEGDVYVHGQRVTKVLNARWLVEPYTPLTVAEQKVKFYAHRVAHLLFPKHVLKIDFAGTTPKGVFELSKYVGHAPVPPQGMPEVMSVSQKLHKAGIFGVDMGPNEEPNYAFKGGNVFFFEIGRLIPNKVRQHVSSASLSPTARRQVEIALTRYEKAISNFEAIRKQQGV